MTFEDVEEARQREKQIRRKERELRELNRNLMPSKTRTVIVNGREEYSTGGGSSLPSSPVENHLRQVMRLEEQIRRLTVLRERFRREWEAIPDEEVADIIRLRTDSLCSWQRISWIVFRSNNESTARMRLKRYTDKAGN